MKQRPNPSKIEPKSKQMHWITQSGHQMAPKTPLLRRGRRFWAIFGSPRGPQKRPKIDFLRQRVLQGTRFYRFLWQMPFFLIFWWIFGRFSMNNWWKKQTCFFHNRACFFQTGDPHETLYFTMRKLLFLFFVFLHFSDKKRRKKCSKIEATVFLSKIAKKRSPGTRFGSQNGPELTSERPKI